MHCVPKGGRERLLVACCRSGCFRGLYSFAELLLELSFLSFRLFCLRCLKLRGCGCRAGDFGTATSKEAQGQGKCQSMCSDASFEDSHSRSLVVHAVKAQAIPR